MTDVTVEVGFVVVLVDGTVPVGSVRQVRPNGRQEIVITIENAGEFAVPFDAILDVHSQKVILDRSRLPSELLSALVHAHDAESGDVARSA